MQTNKDKYFSEHFENLSVKEMQAITNHCRALGVCFTCGRKATQVFNASRPDGSAPVSFPYCTRCARSMCESVVETGGKKVGKGRYKL